jgi:hypothetical protein
MQSALNVLFDLITGRPGNLTALPKSLPLLAGGLLFPPAFLLTVLTTWLNDGGTLLQLAKLRNEPIH